jgi:hypothetical protein
MKKLSTLLALFVAFALTAQESYFTIYNFSVAAEDVSTVYKLVDDYYSANKPEGVTVSLYENHFNDSGNNYTHSIVFSGSLDALGGMYGPDSNDTWELFITRVNQNMESGFSSAMGATMASFGGDATPNVIQRYYLLDVEDGDAFEKAYSKYNSSHLKEGITVAMGGFTSGHSPDGENRWVIQGYKDFKTAMGGANSIRTPTEKKASDKAWEEFMDTNGGVELVRSGLRIRLGQW